MWAASVARYRGTRKKQNLGPRRRGSDAHDGRVGRVLAFGGSYAVWPARAPRLTTLHLLPGQKDLLVPVSRAREGFERLMALGADDTLDVAATLGHELHPALMDQAVTRLQTCVPLRHWPAAWNRLTLPDAA